MNSPDLRRFMKNNGFLFVFLFFMVKIKFYQVPNQDQYSRWLMSHEQSGPAAFHDAKKVLFTHDSGNKLDRMHVVQT